MAESLTKAVQFKARDTTAKHATEKSNNKEIAQKIDGRVSDWLSYSRDLRKPTAIRAVKPR